MPQASARMEPRRQDVRISARGLRVFGRQWRRSRSDPRRERSRRLKREPAPMNRLLAAAALLLSVTGALADSTPRASAGPSQMGLAVGATPVFLTVPQFASNAEICAVGAAVNYRDDGQPVVATLGILIPVG